MRFSVFIFCLLTSYCLFAQQPSPDYFLDELAKEDKQQALRFPGLVQLANIIDSAGRWELLRQMEQMVDKRDNRFLEVRFLHFRNNFLYGLLTKDATVTQRKRDVERALKIAEELGDDILMAEVCNWYSDLLFDLGRRNESQFYFWKSITLIDKAGPEYFPRVGNRYSTAGAILYSLREYDACIHYSRKASTVKPVPVSGSGYYSSLNNIGLAYKKMDNFDSAIYYFDQAAAACASENQPGHIWITIPQANKAQIWYAQKKYAQARPLFEADYRSSLSTNENRNAANNLQWLAKIDLVEGKIDSAFEKAYLAIGILRDWNQPEYLANTYETLADIYKFRNNTDSSTKYSLLFRHLHDSIEVASTMNSLAVMRLKLDDEQHRSTIESLEKQRQNEKLERNAVIAVIILLGVIGWMYYNRQLSRLHQQQQLKETALQAAKEKMALFVRTIDEKTELVDKLQQEVEWRKLSPEIMQTLEDLKNKTILTEDDWVDFQQLFEKIYPGFFEKLKIDFPGITYAELRFAAIIRLQLNNKQAGAMLGISSKSASKTRLRLRQRMNIADDRDLEQFILAV